MDGTGALGGAAGGNYTGQALDSLSKLRREDDGGAAARAEAAAAAAAAKGKTAGKGKKGSSSATDGQGGAPRALLVPFLPLLVSWFHAAHSVQQAAVSADRSARLRLGLQGVRHVDADSTATAAEEAAATTATPLLADFVFFHWLLQPQLATVTSALARLSSPLCTQVQRQEDQARLLLLQRCQRRRC